MKIWLILINLLIVISSFSQLHTHVAQYMTNQQQFNPGYADIFTRYNGGVTFRKQWMTMRDSPLTVFANGGYSFTKNHYLGGNVIQDNIANFKQLSASAQYTYHLWLNKNTAIGLGVSAGLQQRSLVNNFVYFSNEEPNLSTLSTIGMNLGTGISIQSQNLDFGISLPHVFNNYLNEKSKIFAQDNNHIYAHLGYKIRPNDDFIFYPTVLCKAAKGSPYNLSLDGHFLINQFYWFGGGYRSDNTVVASFGLFMEKGLRFVYTYETSFFTSHKRLDLGHEITLNYARSIKDNPFAKRRFTTRKGGQFRRKLR